MIIYHGSLDIVFNPEIRIPTRTLDYGCGFYATTSHEQAGQWVRRKMQETNVRHGFINTYDLDLDAAARLRMLSFCAPTDEWLDFVMKNRTQRGFVHDYDIVYGPVANDKVYAAFALYEGGLLSREGLINELKTYKLVDQYLLHTEAALQVVRFLEAEDIIDGVFVQP